MKRSVLAGVAAILAGGAAFAQMDPEPAAPDAAVSPMASPFIATQDPTSFLWNDIIGRPLFNPENETLGTIAGLIFDQNGTIMAITVGVGGFLGIGEKIIAVDIDALDVTLDEDGRPTLLLLQHRRPPRNPRRHQSLSRCRHHRRVPRYRRRNPHLRRQTHLPQLATSPRLPVTLIWRR